MSDKSLLLNFKEVRNMIHVSDSMLRKMCATGEIEYQKIGNRVMFNRDYIMNKYNFDAEKEREPAVTVEAVAAEVIAHIKGIEFPGGAKILFG